MNFTSKRFFLLMSLSLMAYSTQVTATEVTNLGEYVKEQFQLKQLTGIEKATEKIVTVNQNLAISPNVIPPGTPLNRYRLIMTVGQDEELPSPGYEVFTIGGFQDFLNWDDGQIASFREAAQNWFTERFGIDFTGSVFDPVTQSVITSTGILLPLRYQGYYRVITSNNLSLPGYSLLTPTSICDSEFIYIFFDTPTYTGTYGSPNPVTGNSSDVLSFAAYRFFLNYEGTNYKTMFGRSYYPNITVPQQINSRDLEFLQLYSSDFGPGLATFSSIAVLGPNADGKYDQKATSVWTFPAAFIQGGADLNSFDTPPVSFDTPPR